MVGFCVFLYFSVVPSLNDQHHVLPVLNVDITVGFNLISFVCIHLYYLNHSYHLYFLLPISSYLPLPMCLIPKCFKCKILAILMNSGIKTINAINPIII